jgi:hypothetical protein
MWEHGLDSSGSGYGWAAGCCEQCNEPSDSTECNTLMTSYGLWNPHEELPSMELFRRKTKNGTRYLITEVSCNGDLTPCYRVLLKKPPVAQLRNNFPNISWNPKIHCRVYKVPSQTPILSQINPILLLLRNSNSNSNSWPTQNKSMRRFKSRITISEM